MREAKQCSADASLLARAEMRRLPSKISDFSFFPLQFFSFSVRCCLWHVLGFLALRAGHDRGASSCAVDAAGLHPAHRSRRGLGD